MNLALAYRRSGTIARRFGSSFHLAARLLPADRRRHVHALYALARTADDLVDEPQPGCDPATELSSFEQRFRAVLADPTAGASADPVLAAAADTVRRFDIPATCFDRFFASMRQDLTVTSYERWSDLLGYMDGSAAAIGEMLLPLLDPADHAAAVGPARSLGLAFQLTNFLRDVGEDLDRCRQYLPQEDLRRFGVDLGDRRCDRAFVDLMAFEIERCRGLYAEADAGIALLPGRTRLAIGAARRLYGAILDEIERAGYGVFARRVRVPRWRRAVLVGAVLVGRPAVAR